MKNRILLVSGRKAAKQALRIAGCYGGRVRVHVMDVDVAAFLTLETIRDELSGPGRTVGSDMIIIPGMVRGDASVLTDALGVPCFKGPRNIEDLPLVLDLVYGDGIGLSPSLPADDLLSGKIRVEMEHELSKAYTEPDKHTLRIGKERPVYLGSGISNVVAEIIDAPDLSSGELEVRARYYESCGAGIIDVGMVAGVDHSEEVFGIVEVLRSAVDLPLSIDSLDRKEIIAGLDAGVDLVLSLDETNLELMDNADVPVVLIPRDKAGRVPKSYTGRLAILERLLKNAGGQVIADPITEPLNHGFANSLRAYMEFRERYAEVPLMMGAGNVTELADADSVGMNMLLAGIAYELHIDLILSTEASPKTRGAISELKKASGMMYLSGSRSASPKDLPLDLLILKEKKPGVWEMDPGIDVKESIRAGETEYPEEIEDSVFEVYVTDRIIVVHHSEGMNKPAVLIEGDSADALYKEIIARDLIRELSHAAYLGRELAKAEIALKLGRRYVQDENLF